MTFGKTVMIVKDKDSGSVATNLRPITCAPPLNVEAFYWYIGRKVIPASGGNGNYYRKNKRDAKKCTRYKGSVTDRQNDKKKLQKKVDGLGMAWIDFRKPLILSFIPGL